MIVVSNATPLIALAKLGQLELLRDLFGSVLIPHAVYAEVVLNVPNRPGASAIRDAGWIQPQAIIERVKVDYLRADLDAGEAEALVLAEERGADLVLLDEAKARLAADVLGMRHVGTAGLLLLAKRQGHIPALRPLLDQLRRQRFHLSETVYRAVIEQAGE